MRWSIAQKYLSNPATWNCDYCESKEGLKELRNCNWDQLGMCNKCGEISFEDVERDFKTSNFLCPICGGKVRFGKSEIVLGKTYRIPGCPINKISNRAAFLIGLVTWSEEIGILPTANVLFDESLLYFEIRNFVVSERYISEEEMRPKEKKKS